MRARSSMVLLGALGIAVVAAAAVKLNSSKSNAYRLTYPADLVGRDQAQAMVADLDKAGPMDEAKLKQWLPANFKRFGIAGDRVRKLVILPPSKEMKETGIILLTNPADEAAAVAATVKGSKSNSSD